MTATAADLNGLPDWPRLLSREQAAAYCTLSTSAFDDHVRPHLVEIPFGRAVRFDRRQIDRWLDSRATGGEGQPDKNRALEDL